VGFVREVGFVKEECLTMRGDMCGIDFGVKLLKDILNF
jgi:hypothetical protein